jgi:hippurate hydrolase
VLRVGKKLFGEDKVGHGLLPFKASEDFAFFTKHKPGAFFFLSTSKGENQPMIHNCHFNFNDDLI